MPKSNNIDSPINRVRQNSILSNSSATNQSVSNTSINEQLNHTSSLSYALSHKRQKSNSLDSKQTLSELLADLSKQKNIKADLEKFLATSATIIPQEDVNGVKLRINDTSKLIISIERRVELLKQSSELADSGKRLRSLTTSTANTATTADSVEFQSTPHSHPSNISSESIDIGESPTWTLSDITQSLGDKDRDATFLVQKGNDLIQLLQQYPDLKKDLKLNAFGHRIQSLLINPSKEVAATGYRIARYILSDLDSLKSIISLRIPLFIIISLSKDSSYNVEREQAIKLIRRFYEIDQGCFELDIGIVKAIVSIAEEKDDRLKNICIETLVEITIFNPHVIFQSGGLRILFHCILEGPYNLSLSCLIALYKSLDSPDSRVFLRGGEDMISLISAFSDVDIKHHSAVEKLQNCAFLLSMFLKTWVGIISFSAKDFRPIRELVNCLGRDSAQLRDILMDIFFDILRIRTLPWLSSLNSTKKLFLPNAQMKPTVSSPEKELRIVNHYTTLLLSVLLHCGILNKLVDLIQKSNDDVNVRKACFLLTEIYTLTSNLLPNEALGESQKLPSLIEKISTSSSSNTSFNNKFKSFSSTFQIEKVTRSVNKDRHSFGFPHTTNDNFKSYTKEVKIKMKYNMEDSDFKNMMLKTKVLSTKEYHLWNWDTLSDFINGPLMNPKRLEEVIKTTKFFKRIISYYRPFKFRFSSTKKNKISSKYIKVGCELIKMFLATSEGVKYLGENKLLPQIAECIAQVDQYSGISAKEPVFSKERLSTTLSSGYFAMLGVLSSDLNGLRMLEKWQIFTMLYHIIEKNGRSDLIICILQEMDYKYQSHLRVLFGKALTTCDLPVRVWCANYLNTLLKIDDCRDWCSNLLINQLYDPSLEVCTIASDTLNTYCSSRENLDSIINCRPSLDHLGLIGIPVLFRFMSTSLGFNYLTELNFVETEMNEWIDGKNYLYVLEIEALLKYDNVPYSNKVNAAALNKKKSMPLHFFRELVKTQEGLSLLTTSGFFSQLVDDIKEFKNELTNSELILKLKSALWTIGNIGSTELGITLIDEIGITKDIIDIALHHEIWNVKGTAFFVLGLLSSTQEGIEILDDMDWISSIDIINNPLGYCLPKKLNDFLYVESANPYDMNFKTVDNTYKFEINDSSDFEEEVSIGSINKKILKLISNLNAVLSKIEKTAAKELIKLSVHSKEIFENPILLYDVVDLVNNGHYKLHVRKFIFDLFKNSRVLETIIKRDRRRSRDQKDFEKSLVKK